MLRIYISAKVLRETKSVITDRCSLKAVIGIEIELHNRKMLKCKKINTKVITIQTKTNF